MTRVALPPNWTVKDFDDEKLLQQAHFSRAASGHRQGKVLDCMERKTLTRYVTVSKTGSRSAPRVRTDDGDRFRGKAEYALQIALRCSNEADRRSGPRRHRQNADVRRHRIPLTKRIASTPAAKCGELSGQVLEAAAPRS
jgi:hypothetical protein